MKEKNLRIGVYGHCGHALQAVKEGREIDGVEFVGFAPSFAEETMERMEKTLKEHDFSATRYSGLEELLEKGELDVLVVDNLFGEHSKAVKTALDLALHIFCEKPIATELAMLDEIEALQQEKGVVLHGMHTLRYEAPMLQMKKMIADGAVGDIRMVNCQKSYRFGNRSEFYRDYSLYGGTIPWVAIHGIDAIQYLCGSTATEVFARQSTVGNRGYGEMEMSTLCAFSLENGVLAHVNADILRPAEATTHGDDRIRVAGTKGVLEYRFGELFYIGDGSDGTSPVLLTVKAFLFKDFIHAIRTKEERELSTADTFAVSRYALLARQSAETGNIVRIP